MAEQYSAKKKSQNNTQVLSIPECTKEDSNKLFDHAMLIMLVLKYCSDKDHPLRVSDVHKLLGGLFQENAKSQKTTERIFNTLDKAIQMDSEEYQNPDALDEMGDQELFVALIPELYRLIFHGSIHKITDGWGRYYFEPCLQESHIELIKNSIISNQYLKDTEREYLLAGISFLVGEQAPESFRTLDSFLPFIQSRIPQNDAPSRNENYELLKTMNILYTAVSEGLKVKMVYGSYQRDKKLHESSERPVFVLNPFGLFSQNGRHYLLATKDKKEDPDQSPWHFRIDRIVRVEYIKEEDDARIYVKRDTFEDGKHFPPYLEPYFENGHFNQTLYSHSHPYMAIYKKPNFKYCTLKGTYKGLNAAVDAFGWENIILPENEPMDKNSPDQNDSEIKSDSVFTFTVRAEYNSIVSFCLRHHQLVCVVENTETKIPGKKNNAPDKDPDGTEPLPIYQAVREGLLRALENYPDIPT